jgi:hypothetical protein
MEHWRTSLSNHWSGNAWCITCKDNVDFIGSLKTTESGRQLAQGTCPSCGTPVNRILSKAPQ